MFVSLAALMVLQAAPIEAEPPLDQETTTSGPATCDGLPYDEFDFWVGEWSVSVTGKNRKVADSKIERLYNGCAIRENWMPVKGRTGGSLSGYNPRTDLWEQTWIGSSPGPVNFTGRAVRLGIVLTGTWPNVGGPGRDGLIRMTYTPNEIDGSVRQFGQVSYDQGKTWSPSFDYTYVPKTKETQ